MSDENKGVRLQKYLAQCGVASRRQAETVIAEGRVQIDGVVVTQAGTKVDGAAQEVLVDGKIVRPKESVVLAFHKPKNIVCTARDPEGRETVYDLLPETYGHLRYVGRLDFDSSGLLLFTNDGDLIFRLTRPEFGVEKRYVAELEGNPPETSLERLLVGIEDEGELLKAASMKVLLRGRGRCEVEIVLTEGKNREIRRMFSVLGFPVNSLVRVAFAGFELGDKLRRGSWRVLDAGEIRKLRRLAGQTRVVNRR